MSDWKNVQYKDGKLRTNNSGGGGGSSTFAGLEDVSFNNLQNGQVAKYNSTTQKWENANESGGASHTYSTTEQVIGTWIDGTTPVYERVIVFQKSDFSAVRQILNHGISNLQYMLELKGTMIYGNGDQQPVTTGYDWGSAYGCGIGDVTSTTFQINIGTSRYSTLDKVIVIMIYTKTTD